MSDIMIEVQTPTLSLKQTLGIIDYETLRRSTLPGLRSIPSCQPNLVPFNKIYYFQLGFRRALRVCLSSFFTVLMHVNYKQYFYFYFILIKILCTNVCDF